MKFIMAALIERFGFLLCHLFTNRNHISLFQVSDFWGFVLKYSYHYPLHLLCVKLSQRSVSAFLFFLSGYHRGR